MYPMDFPLSIEADLAGMTPIRQDADFESRDENEYRLLD
jgi:hypothetical protein